MSKKPSRARLLLFAGTLIPLALQPGCASTSLNGFDVSNITVERAYLQSGGPPRDGIPSIDRPAFVAGEDADFLVPQERVLGLAHAGVAKAYPIKILDRHEIVNDRFDGEAVAVTYCPLCGSGIAFEADIEGDKTFGVSGLLYNSDVLLYDRQTESLWSQIAMKAVAGPLVGRELTPLPLEHTTWEAWRLAQPDTLVLSNAQGIYPPSSYERSVYPGYESSERVWFPVKIKSRALGQKDWVLGLRLDGQSKAYPYKELARADGPVRDTLAGKDILITYDPDAASARAADASGQPLPATALYWFAWYAFHPDTKVYQHR